MRKSLIAISAALLSLGTAEAVAGGVSFVADTHESYPKQGTVQGRMYVSEQGMRMERVQSGEQVVQISLPKQGIMRILFPAKRTYMEMKAPAGGGAGPGAKPENPCMGVAADRCKRLGAEAIGGIKAEKWQVSPQGAKGSAMVWWDPERKLSLRQELPDGSSSQMNFKGMADYEGRKVERWEMVSVSAKGQQQKAEQLMDRELGIAVREQFPGGILRELRNIRLTKADPSWFQIPQGFRLQQPQQQGGRPGMRR